MNNKIIKQTVVLKCLPQETFNAWLDSKSHSDMTGGGAKIDPVVHGKFTAWDKYIEGETLEIDPKNLTIIQAWRENEDEWPEDYYSQIKVKFLKHGNKETKLEFEQTGIPEIYLEDLEKGWKDYYWKPMQEYFSSKNK